MDNFFECQGKVFLSIEKVLEKIIVGKGVHTLPFIYVNPPFSKIPPF